MTWRSFLGVIVAAPIFLTTGFLACPALSKSPLILAPSGPARTLYNWSKDSCRRDYIPDGPARAFRRADGLVELIATHRENWSLTGRTIASMKPVCRTILSSAPRDGGDNPGFWIESTYTRDGRRIAALVSEDLTTSTVRRGCRPGAQPGHCWLNEVLAAVSDDLGQTFSVLDGNARVVASLGAIYPELASARFGVFTTSNIAQRDDEFYMIAFVQHGRIGDGGNCLFKTDDPFKPEHWRAWDGSDFRVDMRAAGMATACQPLDPGNLPSEVRSLTFDSRKQLWIAVFQDRRKIEDDSAPVSGFYYSLSSDLIHWSAPARIMAAPTRARADSMTELAIYPSLLDPDSRSSNFDTLDSDSPVLLFTLHHLDPSTGGGTMNRDLVYMPLQIQ